MRLMYKYQITISMKPTKLYPLLSVFLLLFCLLAACSEDETVRLSSLPEATLEGEASTLEISFTHGDWRIASVTNLDGYPPVGSTNQLEGLGTIYYGWANIIRNRENALTIEAEDNFDKKERGFIINIEMKTGFYKEQIVVRQQQCTNFYEVESIVYSVRKGDGVAEIESQPWGMTVRDYTGNSGDTVTTTVWPFFNAYVNYSFHAEKESPLKWTKPDEAIYVDMPKDVSDGEIVLEAEKRKYGSWYQQYDNELKEKRYEVNQVCKKQNTYSADIYYKRLQLHFTLTLMRPGGDDRKVFTGTLTKEYPYGCSPIRHEVSDLPPKDE